MSVVPRVATAAGTARLARRAGRGTAFYRRSRGGLTVSSIGVGMYKGAVSDEADALWSASLRTCLARGVNVFDTAIRYRAMRSERVLGQVLRDEIAAGRLGRDEVFVCTKGGLIPVPEGQERRAYVEQAIMGDRGVPAATIYNHLHCLHPGFIRGEVDRSLQNLGLDAIDCYFVHNPELAFLTGPKDEVYERLRAVFEVLEERVSAGALAAYGLSSWNGFRRRAGARFHIDFEQVAGVAREVAGDSHRFRFVELPLSLGMPFAATVATTGPSGARTALQRASELGLDVLISAPLYEGKLEVLLTWERLLGLAGTADSPADEGPAAVTLPVSENSIVQLLDVLLAMRAGRANLASLLRDAGSDALGLYPAALQVVRSTPGVLVALAGMERPEFAAAHVRLRDVRPLTARWTVAAWRSLASPRHRGRSRDRAVAGGGAVP